MNAKTAVDDIETFLVMPALVAGIHAFLYSAKTWMSGT